MGTASQANSDNKRLVHALGHKPIRPVDGYKILTVTTFNHMTGVSHEMILSHDPGNGTGRFNTYLDGDKWRNGWSRWRFVNWMFSQIEHVRSNWS